MRNSSVEVARNGSFFVISIVRNGKVLKQKRINFVSNEELEQIFSTMKKEYIHG
jgi:hypothetical protein